MSKLSKAQLKQNLMYVLPGLGLWIIFLFWILLKSNKISSNSNPTISMNVTTNIFVYDQMTMGNSTSSTTSYVFKNVQVMTWNLQGLMRKKLEDRTRAVVKVIESESPDIIFFQELISSSYKELTTQLQKTYINVIGIGNKNSYSSYFTGIFFRKSMFAVESYEIVPFSNSVMDRSQLILKLSLLDSRNVRFALMTTHLESLPQHKKQRVDQLKQCFDKCMDFPENYNVIFGGDLNLEENEEEGLVPEVIKDLWVESGSLQMSKYTWDMTQNQNEQVYDEDQQSTVRYDRLYFRSSVPHTLKLEKFVLLGKDLVEGTSYYASDHWAIKSTFKLLLPNDSL